MKTLLSKAQVVAALFAIELQLFGIGTSVAGNPGAPRRTTSREPIAWPIDLTVTPSTGPASGQAGGIGSAELVYKTAAYGVAGLSTTGASNANAANCVGVANGQYPYLLTDGVYVGEPGSSPQGAVPYIEVFEEGDFLFNTTTGDSLYPFTPVYLGADGRTVQATVSGSRVGYVSPDQRQRGGVGFGASVAPPSFPITGAAGVQVYVRITPAGLPAPN